MTWTESDPGLGDPTAVTSVATARRTKSDDLRDTAASLWSVAQESGAADWRGRAREPFSGNLGHFTTDAGTLALALDEQAAALDDYAAALRSIQQDQQDLEAHRTEATEALATARALLDAAHTDAVDVARTPGSSAGDARAARSAVSRREDMVSDALSDVRSLDLEWDALVARRRAADRACIDALEGRAANGLPKRLSASSIAGATPLMLLALLQSMSADDAAEFIAEHPEVAAVIATADPGAVRAWWESLGDGDEAELSPAQSALVSAVPGIIGALNGVPPFARVAANKHVAAARLTDARSRLTALRLAQAIAEQVTGSGTRANDEEIAALELEIGYLEGVVAVPPKTQLYLYDPAQSRIIEMFGTPSAATKHVITYVPGTFSSMGGFHDGGVQQVGKWLHDNNKGGGTVAFIAKDGIFPGERSPGNFARALDEANDPDFPARPAERLRQLAAGIGADPQLANAQTTAIGHSWGTANITTSETLGTHYDRVISLSGAGMPEHWAPNSATTYADHSYVDILQGAQATGRVWDGNNPRSNAAFNHGDYYGPAPKDVNPIDFEFLLDQHNRVARVKGNRPVLNALAAEIFE